MKLLIIAIISALMPVFAGCSRSAEERVAAATSVEIDFDFFYERLSPHGEWVEVDDYGWFWCPDDIDDDWRPYCEGHWIYSDDYGWCWESDEEFGWAVYHYGRWAYVDECGWVWVPGYEWSGAWVCWRRGGGYCGWAPLPPRAVFVEGRGITELDFEVAIYGPSWVFVVDRDICAPRVRSVFITGDRVSVLVRETSFVGAVTWKSRPFNAGIDVVAVERVSVHHVARVRIEATSTLGAAKVRSGDTKVVKFFKPSVNKDRKGKPPDHADREAINRAQTKTLHEKHEAERKDVERRSGKERDEEARKLDERQKREARDLNDKLEKQKAQPPKEPRKVPRKDTPRDPPRKEEPKPRKEQPEPRKEQPKPPPKERPKPPPKEKPPKKPRGGKD